MDTVRYVIHSSVARVERRIDRVWVGGTGEGAKFKEVDKGWYILLTNSYEALYVGFEEPNWKVGDKVKITLEKEFLRD
jgi:hypothetical protein